LDPGEVAIPEVRGLHCGGGSRVAAGQPARVYGRVKAGAELSRSGSLVLALALPIMQVLLHVRACGRKLSAGVCLLAILLLWFPLWAAAWQAQGMACCDGDFCAAKSHATSERKRPASSESASEYEHHGDSSGMMNCAMSCCHESDASVTASAIFILPAPTALLRSAVVAPAAHEFSPAAFVPAYEPLSPPPRIASRSV
jgi:hypothetical protein